MLRWSDSHSWGQLHHGLENQTRESLSTSTGKKVGKTSQKCSRREKTPNPNHMMMSISWLALSCCFTLPGTKCLVGLWLLQESHFKESYFLNWEFNKNKHWDKNVTRPWQRTVALRRKGFFELQNKNTGAKYVLKSLAYVRGMQTPYLAKSSLMRQNYCLNAGGIWSQRSKDQLKKAKQNQTPFTFAGPLAAAWPMWFSPWFCKLEKTGLELTYH